MIHEDGVHKYSLVNLERLLQDCHGELLSETKDYVAEWFLRGRRQGFFRDISFETALWLYKSLDIPWSWVYTKELTLSEMKQLYKVRSYQLEVIGLNSPAEDVRLILSLRGVIPENYRYLLYDVDDSGKESFLVELEEYRLAHGYKSVSLLTEDDIPAVESCMRKQELWERILDVYGANHVIGWRTPMYVIYLLDKHLYEIDKNQFPEWDEQAYRQWLKDTYCYNEQVFDRHLALGYGHISMDACEDVMREFFAYRYWLSNEGRVYFERKKDV